MIQLLIVAAILGLIYFVFLGGNTKIEKKPGPVYQQEIQRVQDMEQSMLQAVDRKKRDIDRQTNQN